MPENRLWTRSFTTLILGSAITMLGHALSSFAVSLLVLDYTGSVLLYSLYMVAYCLPMVLMPLLAGPWMDNFSRVKMLYWLDFFSAFLYLGAWALLRRGLFSYGPFLVAVLLVGSIDSIYLVAYDSENAQIRHYRVDRMRMVSETEEKREGREEFARIDVAEYSSGIFGMFGGSKTHVTFRCKAYLADVVLDRFGKDVMMTPEPDGFRFHADINVSPQFFGWVASFGGDIRIEGPSDTAAQFKKHLIDALSQYE